MPSQRIERLRKTLDGDTTPLPIDLLASTTEFERREFLKLAKESTERMCEAQKLYVPLPFQEAYHKCTDKECILIKGNRAGGSTAGFMEDARAGCGTDPYQKYPTRDGTIACLGYGEKHISRVIHKFLFRAGAFRIIRDPATRLWRVYRPWAKEHGGDGHRFAESKPAPPFIPTRFIEEFVWEKRGERVFSVCRLTTGWQIYAMNSAGEPGQAQGFDVDLYHIDEDTARPGWYEEAVARVGMTDGKIRWTALPHARNDDILNMMQRAESEDAADVKKKTTVMVRASMYDNPYLPEESKKAMTKAWADQGVDVLRKRAYGELVLDSVLMYPSFNKSVHSALESVGSVALAQKILAERNGNPPMDWCLDMVVDPGHTICAVLFFATPPPKYGEFHMVYRELYMPMCTAEMFGVETFKATRDRTFQRFIIDAHGGRLTDIGSGISPRSQYEHQLSSRNIVSEEVGSYFINGSDDIHGREAKLREWLRIRPGGHPTLLINMAACPNLVRELQRFKKKQTVVSGQFVTLDEANRSAPCHAIECCEYAAAHGLHYVPPKPKAKHSTFVGRVLEGRKRRSRKRAMRASQARGSTITLGPRGV